MKLTSLFIKLKESVRSFGIGPFFALMTLVIFGVTNYLIHRLSATTLFIASAAALMVFLVGRYLASRKSTLYSLGQDAARLSLIAKTQQEIAAAKLNPEVIFPLMAQRACDLTSADGSALQKLDGDDLVVVSACAVHPDFLNLRLEISGNSLMALCLRTGEIQLCVDTGKDGRVNRDLSMKMGVRSMIALPLIYENRIYGVLSVVSKRPRAFGDREVEVMKLMAGLLSSSVAHTHEFEAKTSALHALQESESQFRALSDATFEGVAIHEEGRILEANRAFVQMFGYQLDETINRSILEFVPSSCREDISRILTSEEELPLETKGLRKNGIEILIEVVNRRCKYQGRSAQVTSIRDITERQLSQRSLQESEERFKSAFENAPMGIAHANLDGKWYRVNQTLCDMLGYTRNELESGGRSKLIYAQDPDFTSDAATRELVASGQNRVSMEKQYRHKGGRIIWAFIHISIVRDTQGKPQYMVWEMLDITERKHTETVLKETTKTLKTLIDAAPVSISVLGTEGNVQMWNPAAERMFGWAESEIKGSFIPILTQDKGSEFKQVMTQLAQGRKLYGWEVERHHRDGSPMTVRISAAALFDDSGKPFGIVMLVDDVSDRKRTEEALKASEMKFRSVMQSVHDGIIASNEHGNILSWNQGACEIFGYTQEEVLWKPISLLVDEKDSEAHQQLMRESLHLEPAQLAGQRAEFVGKRKDGSRFDMELSLASWRNANELYFTSVIRDITERKRIEQNLISAREQADQATKAKSQFLANMSHEIRTPLNGIMGMTGLLLDTAQSLEQRDYAETIKRSADTLLTILNDILDFSKVEAGKLELEHLDFDPVDLIEDTRRSMAFMAQSKGLKLETSVDASVPPYLKGDPGRLRQVLTNLVNNALKFTQSGGVSIQVSAKKTEAGAYLFHAEVRDSGIGIPDFALSRMFQAFSQADASTTRKFGGTGLGLSISKRLVDLMKGQIGLESKEGEGSRFWFTLPLELGHPPKVREMETHAVTKSNARPARILVAEDNPVNQKITIKILEKAGYRADAVGDGKEVLDALREIPYDIVLMDCQMPEMDGYEATAAIRDCKTLPCRNLPIIAITADALKGTKEKCLAAGMNDYLSKPLNAADLIRVVSQWVPFEPDSENRQNRSENKSAGVPSVSSLVDVNQVIIDRRRLDELSRQVENGWALIAQLIDLLEKSAPEQLQKMKAAIAKSNPQALSYEAHSLKSSSANLGARAMSAICLELEMAGKAGSLEGANQLVEDLQREFDRAVAELSKIRRKLPETKAA